MAEPTYGSSEQRCILRSAPLVVPLHSDFGAHALERTHISPRRAFGTLDPEAPLGPREAALEA